MVDVINKCDNLAHCLAPKYVKSFLLHEVSNNSVRREREHKQGEK